MDYKSTTEHRVFKHDDMHVSQTIYKSVPVNTIYGREVKQIIICQAPPICDGCRSKDDCSALTFIDRSWNVIKPQLKKIKDCPCLVCLIKGICGDECHDYIQFCKLFR